MAKRFPGFPLDTLHFLDELAKVADSRPAKGDPGGFLPFVEGRQIRPAGLDPHLVGKVKASSGPVSLNPAASRAISRIKGEEIDPWERVSLRTRRAVEGGSK